MTIVVATFNSQRTLSATLESIRGQTHPPEQVELLAVDGGSTDATHEILRGFGCTILPNPRTEPVHAKFLGYRHAGGRYILYLDHDEVLLEPESLARRVELLEQHPEVKALVGSGYRTPAGVPAINAYINEFGDPFSCFYHRDSKAEERFLPLLRARCPVAVETEHAVIFDLAGCRALPFLELCAMGSMFDVQAAREAFPETLEHPALVPHMFYLLASRWPRLAVTTGDPILHDSADRLRGYLGKIRWRVKNAVHHRTDGPGAAGFAGRARWQSRKSRLRAYLFLPYALLVLPALLDAVRLALGRRRAVYLLHLPLAIYTAALIVWHQLLHVLGLRPALRSYDESTVLENRRASNSE